MRQLQKLRSRLCCASAPNPVLEELDQHEDGDQVHEGRVELEADGGRADVVAGRHDALHGQGQAHGVVQLELLGHAVHVGPERVRVLLAQLLQLHALQPALQRIR